MGPRGVYPRIIVRRRRSIAGPLVLILIGVFFLLGNLGMVGWHQLGLWFAHYWPFLLIVWGIVRLVEYFYARDHDYAAPGLGLGGALILVFLICFGLAATGAAHFDWNAFGDNMNWNGTRNDWGMWWGNHYDFSDTLEQPFQAGQSLRINAAHGDISLLAGDDGKLKVVVSKQVQAENQSQADRENIATKPTISVDGNTVTLASNISGQNGWGRASATVNLEVYLPRKGSVEFNTSHGDVKISGRDGDVKVTSNHGDVTVEDVSGNGRLTVNHGDLTVQRLQGDLDVDGRVDEVQIADIGGNCTLTGDYFDADVSVSNVGKLVRFESSKTDLQVGSLPGQLKMDASDLHVTDAGGGFRIRTHSKDMHLENVGGDISIDNRNGDIELHAGARPLGDVSINNANGPIEVYLPPRQGFNLQASTREGSIESDFEAIKISSSGDNATANGSTGAGGRHIQLSDEHADIQIRKGVAESQSQPQGSPSRSSRPARPPKPPAPVPMAGESRT